MIVIAGENEDQNAKNDQVNGANHEDTADDLAGTKGSDHPGHG